MTTIDYPRIQFATTNDGVRLAYSVTGQGPPLIYMQGWVSHLEWEWRREDVRYFMQRLSRHHTLIRYDGRGTGLSDRDVPDVNVATHLGDLETIVGHLGIEQFTLLAWSQRTPAAIIYAAEHPERIDRLILYSPFAQSRMDVEQPLARALIDLIRAEWGVGARATLGFVHPDADREQEAEAIQYLRESSSGEVAARILEDGFFNTDVTEYVSRISAPTLIMQRSEDKAVPPECARQVASLLPSARFMLLEGDHHLPFEGDAEPVLREIDEFLGVEPPEPEVVPLPGQSPMPAGPVTILFTDLEGSTALTGRLGDAPAQQVIQEHNAIVRGALRAHGGTEIKHTGDGIMASFPSASAGLESAIAIQRELTRRNEAADAPINVRIGLNCGEPVEDQGDLFGVAVQLARRICDHAQGGQVLASNVVRELVAGKGFLFADQGETALRGFEDPVRVFQVHWQE
jgi:class 3 adenylate cyclase